MGNRSDSEIKLTCPHCGQHISADQTVLGKSVQCPTCNGPFVAEVEVPVLSRQPSLPPLPPLAPGNAVEATPAMRSQKARPSLQRLVGGLAVVFVLLALVLEFTDDTSMGPAETNPDSESCYQQGIAHLDGEDGEPDPQAAFSAFRAAAEGGHDKAQYEMGLAYLIGRGMEPDVDQAIAWLEKAIAQGSPEAMATLGWCYATGQYGVPRDLKRGRRLVETAANKGYAKAMRVMGRLYSGLVEGFVADENKALFWYQKSAELGDPEAQNQLAGRFLTGTGVRADLGKAIEWYQKSAEQGFPDSQVALGTIFAEGRGVERDINKARELITSAAEKDYIPAQKVLSSMLWTGEVFPKDLVESFRWKKRAADLGDIEAQFCVGVCYMGGFGTEKNPELSQSLIQKAAAGGYLPAQHLIEHQNRVKRDIAALQRQMEQMQPQPPPPNTGGYIHSPNPYTHYIPEHFLEGYRRVEEELRAQSYQGR